MSETSEITVSGSDLEPKKKRHIFNLCILCGRIIVGKKRYAEHIKMKHI